MNGLLNLYFFLSLICVGSLLNVIIYRLPIQLGLKEQEHKFKFFNLFLPRSHCRHCGTTLKWWQNIPILSYIFLKGRCYFCLSPIPIRYCLIEISYPILVWAIYWKTNSILFTLCSALFIALLFIQAFIDLELYLLPDPINYLIIWSGLIVNSHHLFCTLNQALWGAIIGYMGLWTMFHLIRWLTQKEGFGYGDFKLFAGIGAWLGIYKLWPILILASLIGIFMGINILIKQNRKIYAEPIPFGPALCLAAYGILLWPEFFNYLNPLARNF